MVIMSITTTILILITSATTSRITMDHNTGRSMVTAMVVSKEATASLITGEFIGRCTADHHGFRAEVKTNEPGTANQNPANVHLHSSAYHNHHHYDGGHHHGYHH
ncbi:uncharacterized protein LOC118185218 [Stegodyphus dumicola]|uniref:uncharacterized protein LOC118185218 n=1 Tax=Stegodyphus dumicola TaxID=202533 RepID=UPI0015AEBC48|nr:uncharacterized protein LOC118185218 [Stegodyphus dumicola]